MNFDDELRKALGGITLAQRESIKKKFGSVWPETPTAEELVLILHLIAQERIGEIEAKALDKLSGLGSS